MGVKKYDDVKYKGAFGSVLLTSSVLIFSPLDVDGEDVSKDGGRELSWQWSLIQNSLIKTIKKEGEDDRHQLKVLFHSQGAKPVILELSTRDAASQMKKDISSALDRASTASTTSDNAGELPMSTKSPSRNVSQGGDSPLVPKTGGESEASNPEQIARQENAVIIAGDEANEKSAVGSRGSTTVGKGSPVSPLSSAPSARSPAGKLARPNYLSDSQVEDARMLDLIRVEHQKNAADQNKSGQTETTIDDRGQSPASGKRQQFSEDPSPRRLPESSPLPPPTQPGAVSVAGIDSTDENDDERDIQIGGTSLRRLGVPPVTGHGNQQEEVLIEAHLVEEGSQRFRPGTDKDYDGAIPAVLPVTGEVFHAEPLSIPDRDRQDIGFRDMVKSRKGKVILGIVFFVLLLVILIAAVLVVALSGDDSKSKQSGDKFPPPRKPPQNETNDAREPKNKTKEVGVTTTGPAVGVEAIHPTLVTGFGGTIPDSTIAALSSTGSPQAKAYQWLEENHDLDDLRTRNMFQRFVLASFYFSTNGDNWDENDAWLTNRSGTCNWEFQNPGPSPCRENLIWAFDLSNNNLQGSIAPEIFSMGSMAVLALPGNPLLTGTIPTNIGLATGLDNLVLAATDLSGALPSELGLVENLGSIDVSNTAMTGNIPPEVCSAISGGSLTVQYAGSGITGC